MSQTSHILEGRDTTAGRLLGCVSQTSACVCLIITVNCEKHALVALAARFAYIAHFWVRCRGPLSIVEDANLILTPP